MGRLRGLLGRGSPEAVADQGVIDTIANRLADPEHGTVMRAAMIEYIRRLETLREHPPLSADVRGQMASTLRHIISDGEETIEHIAGGLCSQMHGAALCTALKALLETPFKETCERDTEATLIAQILTDAHDIGGGKDVTGHAAEVRKSQEAAGKIPLFP